MNTIYSKIRSPSYLYIQELYKHLALGRQKWCLLSAATFHSTIWILASVLNMLLPDKSFMSFKPYRPMGWHAGKSALLSIRCGWEDTRFLDWGTGVKWQVQLTALYPLLKKNQTIIPTISVAPSYIPIHISWIASVRVGRHMIKESPQKGVWLMVE